MAGLVQLELSVQGNICGNNPTSLAVAMKYNRDGSGTELSLVTSGPYAPKPGVMYACLAYFKGSTTTVPVAIDDYIYSGRVNEPHKFIIELDDSVKKLVTATINTTTKTYDVVVEDLR
jgi:hypothetical protein